MKSDSGQRYATLDAPDNHDHRNGGIAQRLGIKPASTFYIMMQQTFRPVATGQKPGKISTNQILGID